MGVVLMMHGSLTTLLRGQHIPLYYCMVYWTGAACRDVHGLMVRTSHGLALPCLAEETGIGDG